MISKQFKNLYSEQGLALFFFRSDSLLFWSTNRITLPEKTILSSDKDKTIFRLKNGWYEIVHRKKGQKSFVGVILLANRYPFENDYLRNGFQEDFGMPPGTEISLDGWKTDLQDQQMGFPSDIRIHSPGKAVLPGMEEATLTLLYTLGFIFLILALYHTYCSLKFFNDRKWLLFPVFAIDLILLRTVLFYFRIPHIIYESALFGPECFSSSMILPSLGDFLINMILILIVAYLFYSHFQIRNNLYRKRKIWRSSLAFFLISLLLAGLAGFVWVIYQLTANSNIALTLQHISTLNGYSFIAFIIVALAMISYLLIGWVLLLILKSLFSESVFSKEKPFNGITAGKAGIFLLFISIVATISLNHFNRQVEHEKRQLLAVKLSTERDPVVEMLFSGLEEELFKNPVLSHFNSGSIETKIHLTEDSLIGYLTHKYFRESWNNYNVQITICKAQKDLRIQPGNYTMNCYKYFNDILHEFGRPTSSPHFFYLDYGYGFRNYLAVIPIDSASGENPFKAKLYIEISSKLLLRDQGYPGLLIDKKHTKMADISDYSYAFYREGKLIHRVGTLQYSLDLDHSLSHKSKEAHFYESAGMDNYCYPINRNNVLILSIKEDGLLDTIAPFSYLFILFLVMISGIFVSGRMNMLTIPSRLKFSQRMQLAMTGVLAASLILIGLLVIVYIIRLNQDKNLENLRDHTHSMLVEMQHNIGDAEHLGLENRDEMNELLTKFSNVFFCDVNLYDPRGNLIATSRPEIFEEGLIAKVINYFAWEKLIGDHNSLVIQDETIGTHRYSSSYIPIFNDRNQLLAFLNLPYFAQQEDLNREISTFLMAFINIYLFLLIVGVFIAYGISNYITRPLRLLTLGLGKLTLGTSNEKLNWLGNDEVGQLVAEYNRKIDELAKSAELLSKSERESAWREMARQVAHEIKNPLTPMKLSVQYLFKSWEEKQEDWEQKLRKFTTTMVEQIDSLAFIASEFSDFAKMPASNNETFNPAGLINNAISLYQDSVHVKFFLMLEEEEIWVHADKKQLSRVFTNLINNSLQAIGEKDGGEIVFRINRNIEYCTITVTDNGSGIPEEQAGKIFQPNFTTKSSGMGLGLAIVRNIIMSAGGSISFTSTAGSGTTFTIELPVVSKEMENA
ncbi:MAG: ATP-binding protein [Bacteroidota bacterium]